MPRVENCGNNVTQWSSDTGDQPSTFDMCGECAAHLVADPLCFAGNDSVQPYNGDPVGTGGLATVDHPPYDEIMEYCCLCNNLLTSEDD